MKASVHAASVELVVGVAVLSEEILPVGSEFSGLSLCYALGAEEASGLRR